MSPLVSFAKAVPPFIGLLVLVSCGDDGGGSPGVSGGAGAASSSSGGGGSSSSSSAGSGAGGAHTGRCTGISGERVVASLTAAERDAACQGFNECAVAPFEADPVDAFCRFAGNFALRLAAPPPSTDDEAANLCSVRYEECRANPQSLSTANAAVQEGLARTCEGVEACPNTIAEVERCEADVAASSSWSLRDCADATASVPPSPTFLELESCKSLPPSCLLLFAESR
jgi:hypothetical protein